MVQQSGLAVTSEDFALNPDDSGDVRMPVRVGEFLGGIEYGHGPALVAVAPFVMAVIGPEWFGGNRDFADPLEQGGLVVLDLDDQRNVGLCCNLEMFF